MLLLLFLIATASANVLLIDNETTVLFQSIDAGFGPQVITTSYSLVIGNPIDGCNQLVNTNLNNIAVLLRRSNGIGCSFGSKVNNAQLAGYSAVIIYDYIEEGLFKMKSSENSVNIPSVLVSLEAGQWLHSVNNGTVIITSRYIPFVGYLLAICSLLITSVILVVACTTYRRCRNSRIPTVNCPECRPLLSSQIGTQDLDIIH